MWLITATFLFFTSFGDFLLFIEYIQDISVVFWNILRCNITYNFAEKE
jgi:hypothetical protein